MTFYIEGDGSIDGDADPFVRFVDPGVATESCLLTFALKEATSGPRQERLLDHADRARSGCRCHGRRSRESSRFVAKQTSRDEHGGDDDQSRHDGRTNDRTICDHLALLRDRRGTHETHSVASYFSPRRTAGSLAAISSSPLARRTATSVALPPMKRSAPRSTQ